MPDPAAGPALHRRPLGRTGLSVGEVGLGAWALGGGFCLAGQGIGYGTTDEGESLATLAHAFELGVNFVDTADAYGAGYCETLIGKALKTSPRRVHVATKVGRVRRDPEPPKTDFSPDYIRQACDRSLHRLGVTCIDLYQLHNPPREVIQDPAVWGVLRELKDRNKIAHYGLSASAPEDGILAIECGEAESVQVIYHLLERGAARELFPLAERKGVGIVVREPLANGLLTGKWSPGQVFPENDHRRQKYPPEKLAMELRKVEDLRYLGAHPGRSLAQVAIQFTLLTEAVSVVIPGAKTPRQVEENLAAVAATEVSAEEWARLPPRW